MLNNKIDAPREALGVSTPGLTRAVIVSVGVPERDCAAGKQHDRSEWRAQVPGAIDETTAPPRPR